MNRLIYHITRLLLAVVPVINAMEPAIAQVEVYQNDTTCLSVNQLNNDIYHWDIFKFGDKIPDFAKEMTSNTKDATFVNNQQNGSSVKVVWHEPGIYFFRIVAKNSCTNNLKIGQVIVKEALPGVILQNQQVCVGDWATQTFKFTGHGPWDVTYTVEHIGVKPIHEYTESVKKENLELFDIETTQPSIYEYKIKRIKDSKGIKIYNEGEEPTSIIEIIKNTKPIAENDVIEAIQNMPIEIEVLKNDIDPDGELNIPSLTIFEHPKHGEAEALEENGIINYTPNQGYTGMDTLKYYVCDKHMCGYLCDTAFVWINILPDWLPDDDGDFPIDCSLIIPDGFSPNGDGVHDFFQVYCIKKYPNAIMKIFDRAGNKLFEKHHYGNLDYWGSNENAWWWGKSQNRLTIGRGTLPAGTYLYVLDLGNGQVRTGPVMIAY